MGDWLFSWFYELMYILQKSICYLLDFIRDVFCKLAGIDTVAIKGENKDLLSHFLLSDGVKNAFWGVFLVGVILLFIFVIIAIIKSEAADPQHKKTKGQIITKALQSFITFLLVPFLLIAGISLVNAVMGAIHGSMTGVMLDGNGNSLIGGQILVTSGYDAYIGPSNRAEIERMFITGELNYNSLSVVQQYYDLADMNFFVGIASGLVILIMFVISAIIFVQRIFDIILLYIVSPASVATIPLDDGGRFRIWREMIISKVLGAYGIILSMNIFFLIVPQLSQISFFDNAFKNGIVQLLFILGGAFAITKANMVISQLTGSNAGAQEAQQMLGNIHTGVHMMRTAGRVATGAAGAVIGGTDFLANRRHGASFFESVSAAAHSHRNQRIIEDDDDKKNGGEGTPPDKPDDDPNGGGSGGNSPTNGTDVQTAAKGDDNDTPPTTGDTQNSETTLPMSATKPETDTATDETDNTAKPTTEESEDVSQAAEKSKVTFGTAVKGTTRLATLPAGVLKDLIQGGVIVAGKNFIPRVRNVMKGQSIVNHADVKKAVKKDMEKETDKK